MIKERFNKNINQPQELEYNYSLYNLWLQNNTATWYEYRMCIIIQWFRTCFIQSEFISYKNHTVKYKRTNIQQNLSRALEPKRPSKVWSNQ